MGFVFTLSPLFPQKRHDISDHKSGNEIQNKLKMLAEQSQSLLPTGSIIYVR